MAYLKAIGNPDGPHALVKDLLGTHLAAMLGLPTFDYAVIEVTDLDELPFFRGGNAEPEPAFVTRGADVADHRSLSTEVIPRRLQMTELSTSTTVFRFN